MENVIYIIIALFYFYYIIRRENYQPWKRQDSTKAKKALSFVSCIVLVLMLGGAWGFALGAAYKLYSFPKEHSFIFNITSLLILIVALELMDFIRIKLLKIKNNKE